jgi:hypothetical protein
MHASTPLTSPTTRLSTGNITLIYHRALVSYSNAQIAFIPAKPFKEMMGLQDQDGGLQDYQQDDHEEEDEYDEDDDDTV